MGLLDQVFGGDPGQQALTAAALSLIGAKGKHTGSAFANAGLLGMNTYQGAQQQQQNQARQGLLEQLTKQQIDSGALEMEQKRRAVEQQNKIAQLQTQFARTPQQNALLNGQGPTLGNAANIGPAGFDYQGYANALAGIDPMAALSLQGSLQKAEDKPISVKPGEFLVGKGVGNKYEALFSAPELDNPNKPFRLVNGESVPNKAYQDYELRKAQAGRSTSSTNVFNNTKDNFKNERDLRNDFAGLPTTKAFNEVRSAYDQIKVAIAQASPAGDLAAGTKIMKLLDPGSVVRESELGMAMAANGMMDRVQNYASLMMSGQKLTPNQRQDFLSLATKMYEAAESRYNDSAKEYQSVASDYGLNPSRVAKPSMSKQSSGGAIKNAASGASVSNW